MSIADAAVIGAGPYGLSIAAYLRRRHLNVRVFGRPMETWREHMPKGMHLKSEGFASQLFDPDGKLTLANFCSAAGSATRTSASPSRSLRFATTASPLQKSSCPIWTLAK